MSNALFDLSSRVAIVTGTSRGLGQYMARALAKAGADLVLTSRDRNRLLPFETEIKALGRRAVSLELDVRERESIEKMTAAAEAAFGHVDILVNNAGSNVRKPALEVTWEDWNLVLDTNLRGSFFVSQAVARGMVARRYGRIINIGSVTSVAGYAGLQPQDLDAAVVFLAAESSGYVTGQTLLVDGGISTGATRALPRSGPASGKQSADPT